jgi:hypothetical protein
MKLKKKVIIKKVVRQINKGGVTYDLLLNKDYKGTSNIAISPFPERSQIVKGRATTKIVNNYCKNNSDLLLKHFALGAWFNSDESQTYLDITALISLKKEREAKILGKISNQISGFNLLNLSEIPLGGTGRFNSLVAPFENRLKTALTLMNQ